MTFGRPVRVPPRRARRRRRRRRRRPVAPHELRP